MTGYTGTLTEAQIERIGEVVDWWMGVALSTERCDRPAAEAAVRAAYAAAGLDQPRLMVWRDSPKAGLDVLTERGDRLRDRLRAHLRAHLRAQLYTQLLTQLGTRLYTQLLTQLQDRLDTGLHTRLLTQLDAGLDTQAAAWLGTRMGSLLYGRLGPWRDGYGLVSHTLAREIAGLAPSPRLETLTAAVAQLGWWWPLRDAVVLTDKPTAIHRDPQNLLHNPHGPALVYADGFGGSWWHGTPVPDDMVTTPGWDVPRIMTERNTEVRRCAIERLGWDRFAHHGGLTQVGDDAPDPGNPGQVLRLYDLPPTLHDLYGAPARVLIVANGSRGRDGTRRRYGLPVPADVPDALTAAATLVDVTPDVYRQLARRT